MKNFLLLILLFLVTSFLKAQDTAKIDSLLMIIHSSNKPTAVADAYYDLALRYYNDLDSLKKYAFKGVDYAQNNRLVEKEADAQNMLGIYYMKVRNLEKAEKAQLKSLALYRKLKDTINTNIGRTHSYLGTVYEKMTLPDEAISHIKTAIKILTKKKDESNLLKTYGRLGNLYTDLGRHNEAIVAFEKTKELLDKGDYNPLFHFNVALSLGNAHLSQGHNITAESYYLQSLAISNEGNHDEGNAFSLENLGVVNTYLGNPDKALRYFLKSDSIYKKLEDRESQIRINTSMGNLYLEQKKYTEAEKFYSQGLEIAKDLNYKTGILDCQSSLANLYNEEKKYAEAITLSEKFIHTSKSIENLDYEMKGLKLLGDAYSGLNDYHTAIKKYNQSLNLANQNSDVFYQISNNNSLGKTYLNLQDYTVAEQFCTKGYNLGRTSKYADLTIESCDCLISIFEDSQHDKNALKWLKVKTSIADSLERTKKEIAFKQIETRNKVAKKDEKIAELNSQKSKLEQIFSTYLLPILILLLLLASVLFFFYKKSKSKVVELEEESLTTSQKIQELKEKSGIASQKIEELKKNVLKNHIILKNNTKIYISNLIYIKSEDHYLNFCLSNGEKHFVRGNLKDIQAELPPNFVRNHRSYIVNVNFIKKVNSNHIELMFNIQIPLSKSYKDNFKKP